MNKRTSILDLHKKKNATKIVALTCYTAQLAKILDNHVDILLVGDSLGMTIYGHNNTLSVTKRMMIDHAKCVVENSSKALVVVDMPFGTYESDKIKAFDVASEIISRTNANAVKVEGGKEISETIEFLVSRGIPVMAHLGLMPQKINLTGKYSFQGKNKIEEDKIIEDSIAINKSGAFAVVIEAIKSELAKKITKSINIPTIGIGSGKYCDGQVLVINDLLGLYDNFTPKFVKKFADLNNIIDKSVAKFSKEVKASKFPSDKHSY